jgi:hypothetical protein
MGQSENQVGKLSLLTKVGIFICAATRARGANYGYENRLLLIVFCAKYEKSFQK